MESKAVRGTKRRRTERGAITWDTLQCSIGFGLQMHWDGDARELLYRNPLLEWLAPRIVARFSCYEF